MRYRKKPVVIEAIQFFRDTWVSIARNEFRNVIKRNIDDEPVIETLEGEMKVCEGDYIIRGIKGEFYPCKPDIFEATYEPIP